MHYLVKILVNLEDLALWSRIDKSENTRDELMEWIRSYASAVTEQYEYVFFDWRETENAGRWSAEYPENVILGSEKPETIRRFLEQACKAFARIREEGLQRIRQECGTTDLAGICDSGYIPLIEEISGAYNFDSDFYNMRDASVIITEEDIEDIMADIDNYAIVLFDEHR